MKLTKEDYQAVIDSRGVDLQHYFEDYMYNHSGVSANISKIHLGRLIECAEKLIEAHEAYEEAEEENQIEDYEINMCEGLDEALNIRKEV